MSDSEWIIRFDILYNNITSNQAPGLNMYERCVFLTKAQDEVVKNHLTANSKGNNLGLGFDDSAKRQIDFSSLVVVKELLYDDSVEKDQIDSRSKVIALKENNTPINDILAILNEKLTLLNTTGSTTTIKNEYQVVPISYDEYTRKMLKPYKRPLKGQAWRLVNSDSDSRYVEIIAGPEADSLSSGDSLKYTIRYIRQPKPIIVGQLGTGLTINGYSYDTGDNQINNQTKGCELDPVLYEEILQRAVELAKAAWVSTGVEGLQAFSQTGARSE